MGVELNIQPFKNCFDVYRLHEKLLNDLEYLQACVLNRIAVVDFEKKYC